jgi:hypothetical protein
MSVPLDEMLNEIEEFDSPLSRDQTLALVAEIRRLRTQLERAYLAILNMEAHGDPIPMDVRAEAETWIGERAP